MHVVKLHWQTILFLLILFYVAFMQSFLLLIHFWLGRLSIMYKSILLFYSFNYKQVKNNSPNNSIRNLSILITWHLTWNHFYYAFLCKFFAFIGVKLCVFPRKLLLKIAYVIFDCCVFRSLISKLARNFTNAT